jgi:hypothetical protein
MKKAGAIEGQRIEARARADALNLGIKLKKKGIKRACRIAPSSKKNQKDAIGFGRRWRMRKVGLEMLGIGSIVQLQRVI